MAETIIDMVKKVAYSCNPSDATFDQLAEEVMELHLSLRGKHDDTPAMEWLEIATIAVNALRGLPQGNVEDAYHAWRARHC